MMMVRDNGDGEYGGEDQGDDIQSNHPQIIVQNMQSGQKVSQSCDAMTQNSHVFLSWVFFYYWLIFMYHL